MTQHAAKKVGIDKKDYFGIGLESNLNLARSYKNLFILQLGLLIKNTNY